MTFRRLLVALTLVLTATAFPAVSRAAEEFPPGWLPVAELGEEPSWPEFRDIKDRVHLYLPRGDAPVRGVFVCFVFHSSDPRELARLWDFALVTIPWPMEYDLGHNDKRSGRFELGHASQDMGLLLRYLARAAEEKKHPELASVPIVGWLGQNGSHMCADLYQRAPERVLAWGDSFPNRLRTYPELTQKIPFAFAWEISKGELKSGERMLRENDLPLDDLSCRANTYGFGHGIYSKYNFFAAYIDRCIRLRMPEKMPAPGESVALRPAVREQGWLGDFHPITEWAPIAPASAEETKNYAYLCWMPDEYTAWMWRSYHSAEPDLALAGPVVEYRKKDGKWGGPECGLGYGGYLSAAEPQEFTANVSGEYAKVEFRDGDRLLGEATAAPWKLTGVKLEPGLRALFAVGVKADGARTASRPAFAIVKE